MGAGSMACESLAIIVGFSGCLEVRRGLCGTFFTHISLAAPPHNFPMTQPTQQYTPPQMGSLVCPDAPLKPRLRCVVGVCICCLHTLTLAHKHTFASTHTRTRSGGARACGAASPLVCAMQACHLHTLHTHTNTLTGTPGTHARWPWRCSWSGGCGSGSGGCVWLPVKEAAETCLHTCLHKHTRTHTYTHAHTRTHKHTDIRTRTAHARTQHTRLRVCKHASFTSLAAPPLNKHTQHTPQVRPGRAAGIAEQRRRLQLTEPAAPPTSPPAPSCVQCLLRVGCLLAQGAGGSVPRPVGGRPSPNGCSPVGCAGHPP